MKRPLPLRDRPSALVGAVLVLTSFATGCGVAGARAGEGASSEASATTSAPAHFQQQEMDHDATDGHLDHGAMDHASATDDVMDGGKVEHVHAQLPPLSERESAATPEERAAAAQLLESTRTSLERYEDERAARAAGFVPGSQDGSMIHYRNNANRRDGRVLDPGAPEGLVYRVTSDGTLQLLGAVFTASPGQEAPTPGGPIFRWHTHDESCGAFYVEPNTCTDHPRMMHIWTTDALPIADPWIQPLRDALRER